MARYLTTIRSRGKVYIYHRRRGLPLLPLSPDVDPDNAADVEADFRHLHADSEMEQQRQRKLVQVIRRTLSRSRRRAAVIGCAFEINTRLVLEMMERQQFRCAVSGLPFCYLTADGSRSNPYRPSIDRIRSLEGYVPANVRLVLIAVNLGKADYADDDYLAICKAVAENGTRTERRKPAPRHGAKHGQRD